MKKVNSKRQGWRKQTPPKGKQYDWVKTNKELDKKNGHSLGYNN